MSIQKPKPRKRWMNKVLQAVASGQTIKDAAILAGTSRATVYRQIAQDVEFAAALRDVIDESADILEAEARRRAVVGTPRKKFHDGAPVIDPETGQQYVEYEYSDSLLMFLLRGRRPEVFRDKVEHAGAVALRTVEFIVPGMPSPKRVAEV